MTVPGGAPRKGTKENPLTVFDLPFTVPKAGRYWLSYLGTLVELPPSPVGSVLNLEVTTP